MQRIACATVCCVSSVTRFDASTTQALGIVNVSELTEIHPILDDFSRIPRRPDLWP